MIPPTPVPSAIVRRQSGEFSLSSSLGALAMVREQDDERLSGRATSHGCQTPHGVPPETMRPRISPKTRSRSHTPPRITPSALSSWPPPRPIPSPVLFLSSSSPGVMSRARARGMVRSSSFPDVPPIARMHSPPRCVSPPPLRQVSAQSSRPMRSPKSPSSPFHHQSGPDESWFGLSGPALVSEIESISEDAELTIEPHHSRSSSASVSAICHLPGPNLAYYSASATSNKFDEPFAHDPPYYYSHGSSPRHYSLYMPSTPNSARSRSPSISSLETIPDSPDAEEQAIEQDERDRDERRKMCNLYGGASSDRGTPSRSFVGRDKRKRWSVCGAEKRSDLNLETIWED